MQNIYVKSRRLVASFLIGTHVLHCALLLMRGIDLRASVGVAAASMSIFLLLMVLSSAKTRIGIDLSAFFTSMIGTAVCWGATQSSFGLIAYLIPVVVALGYTTVAVVLKAEQDSVKTRDRL